MVRLTYLVTSQSLNPDPAGLSEALSHDRTEATETKHVGSEQLGLYKLLRCTLIRQQALRSDSLYLAELFDRLYRLTNKNYTLYSFEASPSRIGSTDFPVNSRGFWEDIAYLKDRGLLELKTSEPQIKLTAEGKRIATEFRLDPELEKELTQD
jgi:hypothetical protein